MRICEVTETYLNLKKNAELAQSMYDSTQSVMDWEWFMTCEKAAAEYAYIHEEEIDWSLV